MITPELGPQGPTKAEVIEVVDWFLEKIPPNRCLSYYDGTPTVTPGRFGLSHVTETTKVVELTIHSSPVPLYFTVQRKIMAHSVVGLKPRINTKYQVVKDAGRSYTNANLTILPWRYEHWFFESGKEELRFFGKQLVREEYYPSPRILTPEEGMYTGELRNIVQALWQGLDS